MLEIKKTICCIHFYTVCSLNYPVCTMSVTHSFNHSSGRSVSHLLSQSLAQSVHSFSERGEVGTVPWDKAPLCLNEVILNLGIFSHSVPLLWHSISMYV